MNLAYTIISVDDSREHKKSEIRRVVDLPEITTIPWVDARPAGVAEKYLVTHPDLWINTWVRKRGELGIWFSMYEAWKAIAEGPHDGVVVFEDDALVTEDFNETLKLYLEELPEDWDALALFVPDNQRNDYNYWVVFDGEGVPVMSGPGRNKHPYDIPGLKNISRSYQGYSCVAMLYSRQGAAKCIDLTHQLGIYTPVDCFIFLQGNRRLLNVYAPKPSAPMCVAYDWDNSPTTIHDTESYIHE